MNFPAKAQRRKERGQIKHSSSAPLRLCGRILAELVYVRELKVSCGSQVFDTVRFFELGEQDDKDFGGGKRVTARAVTAGDRNRKVLSNRLEPVI